MKRHAFTLVELLVVITIIMALLAVLLPSMGRAVAVSQDVVCQSQMRQLGLAFLMITSDNFGQLPGVFLAPYSVDEPGKRSWLGNEAWLGAPHEGEIVGYIGGGRETAITLYRCPSLPVGALGSGVGSNGRFDVVSPIAFSGAKLSLMPSSVEVRDPVTGDWFKSVAPIVMHEDPMHYLNTYINVEPGHGGGDRLGTYDLDNGANMAVIDGSVWRHSFTTGGAGPINDLDWYGRTPSGAYRPVLQHNHSGYGDWNRR